MKKIFDFSELNSDHKDAAEEILRVCRNLGYEEMVDNIRSKFQLEDIPIYDITDSSVIKKLKDYNIGYSVQGYTRDNGMDYPYITISDDIRKFEEILNEVDPIQE